MDKILAEERRIISTLKSKINQKRSEVQEKLEKLGMSNLERLREIRETEYGADFQMFLEELHEKNLGLNVKSKFKRLEELTYLADQPFFARIDLSEESSRKIDKVYIAKFGLPESVPSITDWRAKIASVYYRYRYPQKDVYYETPQGIQKRDLLLKRTFEIENGELVKYYNNDIQLDENSVIIEKIEKKTGGVLEDIVETIQLAQMDIIESDPRQVCIVQGCVGSGKSTVAIHKLAHIFFNYPNLIHSDKSIVVAKNQILTGYLSTLFPRLGIFDTNYKTIRELLVNIIYREDIGIKVDLDIEGDIQKFNLQSIRKIYSHLDKVHRKYEKKLNEIFSNKEYEPFAGYKYSYNLTPLENISEILTELEEELTAQKNDLKEVSPDSVRAYLCKENIKVLRSLITRLAELTNNIKNKEISDMQKEFLNSAGAVLNYSQALLYIYIYLSLIGIKKHPVYEYCVVDEGQDFSPIEYALLDKIVLRGRFSIFGDLNQQLEKGGIEKWEDVEEVIKGAKSSAKYELSTNYRSTRSIIEYAKKIIEPYTNNYLPESINRKGPEPFFEKFANSDELLENFNTEIKKDVKNINKSIGIICYNEYLFNSLKASLKKTIKKEDTLVILDKTTKISYSPKSVYLMDAVNSKGLEFSKVYILGMDPNRIGNFEEARKCFVMATRAMNELVIYGVDNEKNSREI